MNKVTFIINKHEHLHSRSDIEMHYTDLLIGSTDFKLGSLANIDRPTAKQLLLHPVAVRQPQEALWQMGTLVPFPLW